MPDRGVSPDGCRLAPQVVGHDDSSSRSNGFPEIRRLEDQEVGLAISLAQAEYVRRGYIAHADEYLPDARGRHYWGAFDGKQLVAVSCLVDGSVAELPSLAASRFRDSRLPAQLVEVSGLVVRTGTYAFRLNLAMIATLWLHAVRETPAEGLIFTMGRGLSRIVDGLLGDMCSRIGPWQTLPPFTDLVAPHFVSAHPDAAELVPDSTWAFVFGNGRIPT